MAKKTYSLTESVILNGQLIVAGSNVSLNDEEATKLKQSITGGATDSEQEANEPTQSNDYDEMTKAELKDLTDELELEVNPTGSKGSFVKADYIKALNA